MHRRTVQLLAGVAVGIASGVIQASPSCFLDFDASETGVSQGEGSSIHFATEGMMEIDAGIALIPADPMKPDVTAMLGKPSWFTPKMPVNVDPDADLMPRVISTSLPGAFVSLAGMLALALAGYARRLNTVIRCLFSSITTTRSPTTSFRSSAK